jgi:hypothetical protein
MILILTQSLKGRSSVNDPYSSRYKKNSNGKV